MVSETDQVTGRPDDVEFNSQFLQLRWNRAFSATADLQVKGYFDRTYRDIPGSFQEQLLSYDADAYHRFSPLAGNSLIWGSGYRLQWQEVENPPPATPGGAFFFPERKVLPLFSAFLQDQQDLWEGRLRLTAGTRLEHNAYTDWEVMPSARAAFSPIPQHTVWAAVSRAVRSPGRIDVEVFTPHPSLLAGDTVTPRLDGGPDFESEVLQAYELGYRLSRAERLSLSLSGFYNVYEGLRVIEFVSPARLQFTNGAEGEVYGAELAGHWQAMENWQLRAGVTRMLHDFRLRSGHGELPAPGNRGNDPEWQATLQSWLDLPRGFELNVTARWVDELPAPAVPAYGTLDAGVVWQGRGFEVSLYGRNLREKSHPEFAVADAGKVAEIPRSVIGRVAWRM
jgi:iron complex outermembrane receptor protein